MSEAEGRKQLERLRRSIKTFHEEEQRLAQELGEPSSSGGQPNVFERKRQEDEDAELFDKLSPADLTELYENDREQWQRIMDAREAVGTRRLMGS